MGKDYYFRTNSAKTLALYSISNDATPVGELTIARAAINEFGTNGYINANFLNQKVNQVLNHLLEQGLLQKNENGIFEPELLADIELREKRRQAGKLGGNPHLVNQEDNQDVSMSISMDSVSSSLDKGGSGGEGFSSSLLVDGKFVPWVAEVFELYPETTRTSDFYAASYWIEQLLGKKTVWGFAIEPEHIKLAVQHYCVDIKVGGYHGTDYVKNAENYFKDFKLVEKFLNPDWKPPRRKPKTYRKGEN